MHGPDTETVLSIVVPVFNEESNIDYLVKRLESVLIPMNERYEIILVNDGSRDKTWEKILAAAMANRNIRGISLCRNFGHQHALLAGLLNANGRAVISMDGDLQHPPELIPALFEAWKKGFKIVNTYREDSEVAGFFKRTTSRYFYKFFSAMTDVPMAAGSSDFRLIDRAVIASLAGFNDVDLFLRGAINWIGYPSTVIPFRAEKRFTGESKYNLKKMMKFAVGAIVSFSVKPLMLAVLIGVITSALSFLEIVYVLIQFFRGATVAGWTSTVAIMSFLFGVLFIVLGIIGVYLSRIHQALQARPHFIIGDHANFDNIKRLH
jgi:dolichol-phosphate mannosyltransferase